MYQLVKSMFGMATASVLVEPSKEECSVCREQFTEPKLLPCGHLLCRHCPCCPRLKSQAEAKCPLCRCAIVEPEERGSKSLEDIADRLFPTDLAMAALVEADRLLNKGHNCCICEDAAATCLCLNCRDMFCQTCRKVHNKQTATKTSPHRAPVFSDGQTRSPLTALPPVQSMPTKRVNTSVPHTACPSAMFAPGHNTEAARK